MITPFLLMMSPADRPATRLGLAVPICFIDIYTSTGCYNFNPYDGDVVWILDGNYIKMLWDVEPLHPNDDDKSVSNAASKARDTCKE